MSSASFRRANAVVSEVQKCMKIKEVWGWTYRFLPVFQDAGENDDVWDVTVFRWVH